MTEPRGGRRQFDAIESHEALIAWSRRYCERAIAVHDLAVDLDAVEWTVSTRARRRAAAVKTPPVTDAVVGESYDWTTHDDVAGGDVAGVDGRNADDPPDCELSLSWAAFDDFDRSEWRDTLRHELIHVEQFQRYGRTDHGTEFRDRAAELDAAVHCRRFADANYLLFCEQCDEIIARRYRASKLVKHPDRYRSNCCEARLRCEEQ